MLIVTVVDVIVGPDYKPPRYVTSGAVEVHDQPMKDSAKAMGPRPILATCALSFD